MVAGRGENTHIEVSCLDMSHTVCKISVQFTNTRLLFLPHLKSHTPQKAAHQISQSCRLLESNRFKVAPRTETLVRGVITPWAVAGLTVSMETWHPLEKLPTLLTTPTVPGLIRMPKDPFSGCHDKFFPTPVTTNPILDQFLSIHNLPSLAGVGPYPPPDLCPGSPIGKWSWLLFCPLNYSHSNPGHWH